MVNFTLSSKTPGSKVMLQFTGFFKQQEILWNLTLYTLQRYQHIDNKKTRQFIDIGQQTKNGREITVALAVNQIDIPTINKTIIMIHHYKKLEEGLHEFGDATTP